MSKDDVKRYIEMEAPDIGMVENEVSEVVCFNESCKSRIEVDPATLVVEDTDAVETIAEVGIPDPEEPADRKRVEIYCSPKCRNNRYIESDTDHPEVPQ